MKSRRNRNTKLTHHAAAIESLESRQLLSADQSLARVVDAGRIEGDVSRVAQLSDSTQAQLQSPRGAISQNSPRFVWSAVNGAARYEFWVNNSQNQRVLYHAGLTGTSATIEGTLPTGTYRWWIRAFDARGRAGTWSLPADFQILSQEALKPVLQSPQGSISTQQPEFRWGTVPGATRYELWVNNSQNQRVIHNPSVTGTATRVESGQLAAGNYRWWVRAYNAAGVTTAWSAPMDFQVQVQSTPNRPTLIAPQGDISSRTPQFQWSPMAGAVRYELWVNDAQNQRVVHNPNLTGPSASITGGSLASGNYRWWVRGFNSRGVASQWSNPTDFRIVGSTGSNNGGDDDREDNDTAATANDLGQLTAATTIGNLVMADAADWFSFVMEASGTSTSYAKISFDHSLGDLDMKLFDQTGALVRESDSATNQELISLESLPAGRYYLQAFGYEGATNPSYSMEISPSTGGGNTGTSDNYRTLFLNFDGANLSYNDLVRMDGGNWLPGILEERFDPERDGVSVDAFMRGDQGREQVISRIIQSLQADLQQFGVQVQRIRSGMVEGAGATTIFIGNTNMSLNSFQKRPGGIASDVDRGNGNPTDIAFVFPQNLSGENFIRFTTDTILHEAGHTWGLFHVNTVQEGTILPESMGYIYTLNLHNQRPAVFADTSFMNVTFVELTNADGSHGLIQGQTEYQNSYQEMMRVFRGGSTGQTAGQLRNLTSTASGNIFQLQSLQGNVHVFQGRDGVLVDAGGEIFALSGSIGQILILATAEQQQNISISSELRELVHVTADATDFDNKLSGDITGYWNGSEHREYELDCIDEHHEHHDHEHHHDHEQSTEMHLDGHGHDDEHEHHDAHGDHDEHEHNEDHCSCGCGGASTGVNREEHERRAAAYFSSLESSDSSLFEKHELTSERLDHRPAIRNSGRIGTDKTSVTVPKTKRSPFFEAQTPLKASTNDLPRFELDSLFESMEGDTLSFLLNT